MSQIQHHTVMPTKRKQWKPEQLTNHFQSSRRSHYRQMLLLLKTKKFLLKGSPSQTSSSTQGNLTDVSVCLIFQKKLLHFCNTDKEKKKRHFPGENVCRRTYSKLFYQIHSLLLGVSAIATVSLSLELFLLRIGIVEINRDSRFSSLIFVLPWRFVSLHQHSQYYTVSSETQNFSLELVNHC